MRLRRILSLILAGLLAGSALLAPVPLTLNPPSVFADPGDWPMVGRDPAHTGYAPGEPTPSFPLPLAWTYQTVAPGSVVVASGVAYFGTQYYPSAATNKWYAVNASTGALWWSYDMASGAGPAAVVGGVLYATAGDGKVYALNASTGALNWTYQRQGGRNLSPLTVADGVVYAPAGEAAAGPGSLYALDEATGALRWRYVVASNAAYTPAVAGGVVYFGDDNGKVYALDATAGTLLWSYQTGWHVRTSPAVVSDTVYVGSGDGRVYALNVANGSLRWSYQAERPIFGSPAVAEGVVYIGDGNADPGKVYALDANTGTLRWSFPTARPIWTSPAVAGGVVYVGSLDRKIYGLDATTGSLRWSYTAGAEVWGPAVSSGMVFVSSSDGKVYAFGIPGPSSSVASLSVYQTAGSFALSWSGTPGPAPIANYDIQYKDGASGTWTDWITTTTALSSTFTGGQDAHTYYFQSRARDTAGNLESYPGGNGDTYTTVDLTAPTGSLQAQGWSSPYISNTITLLPSGTDATSGVGQMQFSGDGQTYGSWESYSTTALYVAPPGATAAYGRFKDNAGNVSQPVSATIALDAAPPSGSVSINGGATYANALTATLTLSSTDSLSGISSMAFSNDGTDWGEWQGYAAAKPWPLPAGADGPRTVFARFRDAAQNFSPVYSDTIILDSTAPTGTVVINGGASDTNSTAVTLTLAAGDALSGISQMSLSNDGQSYSSWEDYATSKSWSIPGGNGTKAVYARFRDNAGNLSTPISDTIILNTVLPSSAVSPLALYQNTAAFTVTWSGTASGSGLAAYDLQYKDGASGTWTDWITSTLSTSAVFTGTEGHTYYFQSRARDLAGNVEPYAGGDGHTRTTVDLTPPSGGISINGGALDTAAVTVTLVLSATDLLSGVSQASYSDDGSTWSGWEAYAAARSWTLPSGDGEKAVWARYRDAAGNVSAPISDTIRLDTSVRSTYGLSVNEGALFTNQVTVTLSLPANPNTADVMLSNDGGFAGADWQPYSAYKAWAITQYGSYVIPRTVYVKYRDVNGNVSATYQDDIILDLTAPSGSVSIEGAGSASVRTAASSVTLRLSASDDVSGVGGMMVSNSPAFSGAAWEPFSATKSWSMESGGKVYVAFKDNAGNASPTYAASLSGAKESLPSIALGTVHPKTGGQIASAETKTSVAFPPGAVSAKAEVTLVPAVESNLQANTGALKSAGKFLTLTAKAGQTPITTMSQPYTITVSYTAADVAGIDESTLGIYWWNGSSWEKEPSSRVDTAAKTVSATLDHLSAFALLGESSTRTVYLPVVVKSYGGGW